MFEVYDDGGKTVDRYIVIFDNPNYGDEHDHKPFYDMTVTEDGGVAHGDEWTAQEVEFMKRNNKRVMVQDLPQPVQLAILHEMEVEHAAA